MMFDDGTAFASQDSFGMYDASVPAPGLSTPIHQCLDSGMNAPPSLFMATPATPAKRTSDRFPLKRTASTASPAKGGAGAAGAMHEASPRKRPRTSMLPGRCLLVDESAAMFPSLSQESSLSLMREESDLCALPRTQTLTQPVSLTHFQSTFLEVRDIGHGSFGRVVLATHNYDNAQYAVKIAKQPVTSEKEQHNKLREARILAKAVECPFIVKYYNSWVDEGHVYLQMEFCKQGSVAAILAASKWARWTDTLLARLLSNIAAALDYLHRVLRVVHLDVKPDNIFQCAPSSSHPAVPIFKLGDFGIAAKNPETVSHALSQAPVSLSRGGTLLEMRTPELSAHAFPSFLSREPSCTQLSQMSITSLEDGDARFVPTDMLNDKIFPKEADIFAFGLSVYEVAAGIPTPKSGEKEWSDVRDEGHLAVAPLQQNNMGYLHRLISSMVAKQAECRPSALQIIEDVTAMWRGDRTADGRAAPTFDSGMHSFTLPQMQELTTLLNNSETPPVGDA